MQKKIISPLHLGEVDIYSLDELREKFTVGGVLSCRKRLLHWLKNQCGETGGALAAQIEQFSSLPDAEWAKQTATVLGCEEKYKRYERARLIRSDELSNDEWVELVRKVGYDDVDMPREELDQYKQAANSGTRGKQPVGLPRALLTRLIRSDELSDDEWVELVRAVGYDDVDMPREELDRYKEAAETRCRKIQKTTSHKVKAVPAEEEAPHEAAAAPNQPTEAFQNLVGLLAPLVGVPVPIAAVSARPLAKLMAVSKARKK